MVQTSEELDQKSPKVFSGKNDFLFLLFLLVVSGLAWFLHDSQKFSANKAFEVVVFSNPIKTTIFSNVSSESVVVKGLLGPATIEWNQAGDFRIASSTCPGKICVNYGWTSEGSIVCVPNGIVVKTLKSEDHVDAVSR